MGGFKRYSGLWKGPPPGTVGVKDIAVGVSGLKDQMKNPMFVSKAGVGYGVDEMQKVVDDGKGWVWLAAEMSPGGLAVELFKSVPYGKRAILVAKQSNVDEMFSKVNWTRRRPISRRPLAAPISSSAEWWPSPRRVHELRPPGWMFFSPWKHDFHSRSDVQH